MRPIAAARLGRLADNGGSTFTHLLKPASPAIGAAVAATAGSDQRGIGRPDPDSGAYERRLCRGTLVNRVGTSGDDTVVGTSKADGIMGLGGDDILNGQDGPDALCGAKGADTLRGRMGDDVLFGAAGQDLLRGAKGDDTLNGGKGTDDCVGGGGSNVLISCP